MLASHFILILYFAFNLPNLKTENHMSFINVWKVANADEQNPPGSKSYSWKYTIENIDRQEEIRILNLPSTELKYFPFWLKRTFLEFSISLFWQKIFRCKVINRVLPYIFSEKLKLTFTITRKKYTGNLSTNFQSCSICLQNHVFHFWEQILKCNQAPHF